MIIKFVSISKPNRTTLNTNFEKIHMNNLKNPTEGRASSVISGRSHAVAQRHVTRAGTWGRMLSAVLIRVEQEGCWLADGSRYCKPEVAEHESRALWNQTVKTLHSSKETKHRIARVLSNSPKTPSSYCCLVWLGQPYLLFPISASREPESHAKQVLLVFAGCQHLATGKNSQTHKTAQKAESLSAAQMQTVPSMCVPITAHLLGTIWRIAVKIWITFLKLICEKGVWCD